MLKLLLVAWSAFWLAGCVFGNVRTREVDALGPYREMPVRAISMEGVSAPQEVADGVQAGLQRGLEAWNQRRGTAPIDPEKVLEVQPELLDFHGAKGKGGVPGVAEVAGLLGATRALDANRITLLLLLRSPGVTDPIGELTWEEASSGSISDLADRVGASAGEALAKEMLERRDQYVTRYPGDERNVFTPTARLLLPGELVLSDDEVLIFNLGAGLTPWLEVGLSGGLLPIPAAGGIAIAGHGAAGAGLAGIVLVGAASARVKLRLLEEGPYWPAIAASYDLVDAFGAALGGGGIFIAGNGIAGVGGVGAGYANLQLNVVSVVMNKRFGPFELGAGATVVDNHHFLPQSAAFAAGVTSGTVSTATYDLDQLPTMYFPFATVSASPWPWLRLMQELFPQRPFTNSFGTTGARLVLGPIPLSRLRVKIDMALTESYDADGPNPGVVFLPWVGAGLYVL